MEYQYDFRNQGDLTMTKLKQALETAPFMVSEFVVTPEQHRRYYDILIDFPLFIKPEYNPSYPYRFRGIPLVVCLG